MTTSDNRELGEPSAALRIDTERLDAYLREHITGYEGSGAVPPGPGAMLTVRLQAARTNAIGNRGQNPVPGADKASPRPLS